MLEPSRPDSAAEAVSPLVLLYASATLAASWAGPIQETGRLCAPALSPKQAVAWMRFRYAGVAVVDMATSGARRVVEEMLAQGAGVIAVAATPKQRAALLEMGCAAALPADVLPEEVAHAVGSVLPRAPSHLGADGRLEAGPLVIEFNSRKVKWHGREVDLPARLFDLLGFLARHPGQAFSTAALLERVWGHPWGSPDSVHHAVARLKSRLEDHGHIVNRRTHGYLFLPEEPEIERSWARARESRGAKVRALRRPSA